jgi:CRISPR-associated protein Csc1
MTIYLCQMTLHDNVFFASREMGILYETEKYLHNWALSYAFFEAEYIPKPYRLKGEAAQKPGYLDRENEQNLLLLNDVGMYVFPAQPLKWNYQVNTFKAAQVSYYGKTKQFGDKGADRNYPINYGRAKELGIGSTYRLFIITPDEIQLPQLKWIRLGKWAAKIKVDIISIPPRFIQAKSDDFTCLHPLNPIDLPPETQLHLYNRIIMPPSSLISQAKLKGDYWHISIDLKNENIEDLDHGLIALPTINLPRGCAYGANANTSTT